MSDSPLLPYVGPGFPIVQRVLWGYLESVDAISGDTLFGPSGDPLARTEPLIELDRRLRFSCVDAEKFVDAQGRIELIGNRPTRAQRMRRKADLLREFGEASLPVVDVYFRTGRHRSRLFRTRLSRWFRLAVDEGAAPTDDVVVVVGDPAGDGEDTIARLELLTIAGWAEERLRNVFSLAHVADVGRDDDPEGEPPITPFDPPPKGSVLVVDAKSARLETIEQSQALAAQDAWASELISPRKVPRQRIVIRR